VKKLDYSNYFHVGYFLSNQCHSNSYSPGLLFHVYFNLTLLCSFFKGKLNPIFYVCITRFICFVQEAYVYVRLSFQQLKSSNQIIDPPMFKHPFLQLVVGTCGSTTSSLVKKWQKKKTQLLTSPDQLSPNISTLEVDIIKKKV
jgi:hypothetical protein